MAKRDHYATLGVSRDSDDVVIRAAYKALMLKYHPDTNRDPAATARAAAINDAYSVLGDSAKRATYDAAQRQQRANTSAPPPSPPAPPSPTPNATPESRPAFSTGPELSRKPALIGVVALIGVSLFATVYSTPNQTIDNTVVIDMNSTDDVGMMDDNMIAVDATMGNDAMMEGAGVALGAPVNDSATLESNEIEAPTVLSATPLDFDTIEAAARQFDKVLDNSGMMGARAFSERCHKGVVTKPSYSALDHCAAFDYAAAALDRDYSNSAGIQRIPYFEFQEDNQADNYSVVGANRWMLQQRLQAIQKSAAEAMADAVMARLARQKQNRSADSARVANSSGISAVTAGPPSSSKPFTSDANANE